MMMTIRSKFGTRGFGVEVRVGKGEDVAVGGIGVGVNVAVGTGVGVGGGMEGTQAANNTRRKMQNPARIMRFSLENKLA
jgi:hypothetical protein